MSIVVCLSGALLFMTLTCGASPTQQDDLLIQSANLEGDILFDEPGPKSRRPRNAVNEAQTWPNGIVYYHMSEEFSPEEKEDIFSGMREISRVSCVKFRKMTENVRYVNITGSAGGCYAYVGYPSKSHRLNLEKVWCFSGRIILHELLHALGFNHENSRSDRDAYVNIHWDNIPKKSWPSFKPFNTNNLGQPYDYLSVMHSNAHSTAINRSLPTISVKAPFEHLTESLGQSQSLSSIDIMKINILYKCSRHLQKLRIMQLFNYLKFKENVAFRRQNKNLT